MSTAPEHTRRTAATIVALCVLVVGAVSVPTLRAAASPAQIGPDSTVPSTEAPTVPTEPPATTVPDGVVGSTQPGTTQPASTDTSGPVEEETTTTLPTRPVPTGPLVPSGPGGPDSTGSTTTVPGTAKPGTNPVADPVGGGDAPSEPVPETDYVIPPLLPGSPILVNGGGASQLIIGSLSTAQVALREAEAAHEAALARVEQLSDESRAVAKRMSALSVDQRDAVVRYAELQSSMSTMAADAYIGLADGADPTSQLIASGDANEYGQRRQYITSVTEGLRDTVASLAKAGSALSEEELTLGQRQGELMLQLVAADRIAKQTEMRLKTAGVGIRAFAAGSEIFVTGFVFPVGEPHEFVDSFGAPREMGTPDAHWHEGTDIMAPAGTPLFACERGVISKVSNSKLGGISLWIKGESGTHYYYAHLATYADGIAPGKLVEAGDIVGYVGSTGNAAASAPHLHFEIHPNDGPGVNPFALLKVISDLGREQTDT